MRFSQGTSFKPEESPALVLLAIAIAAFAAETWVMVFLQHIPEQSISICFIQAVYLG
jgi:hypothetical protein